MNDIDPRAVEAACMADLSRIRQEELPLSNREKKGPSYQPGGRNGTSHYASKLKEELNSKWAVDFDDEEARQIEGLRVENARPWAKKVTKAILETASTRAFGPARQHIRAPPQPVGPSPINPKELVPPIEAKWGPPKLAPTLNPVLPTPGPASGHSTQSPTTFGAQSMTNDETDTQQRPTRLKMKNQPPPGKRHADVYLLSSGRCEVVPSKLEIECFEVEFKIVLFPKKRDVELQLSGPTRKRVHKMSEFDAPVMDAQFCRLKLHGDKGDYYLRLTDLKETRKFKTLIQDIQERLESTSKNTVSVVSQMQTVSTSQPVEVIQPTEAVQTMATVNTTSSAFNDLSSISNGIEETLIDLGGFEEVQNTKIPSLQNAVEHIIHLIEEVVTKYTPKDHLIENVVQGIEDGAIEYWVTNGFMRDFDDDIKENLTSVLRNMAQIKIKMHLRLHGHGKKQKMEAHDAAVRGTKALVENMGPVRYSPEAIAKFQSNAVVPNDWNATKGLPLSAAVLAKSVLERIDTTTKMNIPRVESKVQKSIKEDHDTPMSNTEHPAVVEAKPAPSKTSTQRRPTKGLADSSWARADTQTGTQSSYHGGWKPPVTQSNNTHPKSAGGGQRTTSGSNTGTLLQGLSNAYTAADTFNPLAQQGKVNPMEGVRPVGDSNVQMSHAIYTTHAVIENHTSRLSLEIKIFGEGMGRME
ncbi:hypothetical protein G7Z17_g11161 [Cylindrodendrum hubeiense]|uniref:Uncharacterized protein n=1 Tax=Cylindrodendrum hubeiense TaxID=595255 RepID=A0A9P5H035_9HYPO|nr:hypothetical protein G7Z17_g11161 [Cylindrodendrum hubeiense]